MFEKDYKILQNEIKKIEFTKNFDFVETLENMEIIKRCENIIINIIQRFFRKNEIIISKSIIKRCFNDLIEMYLRNTYNYYIDFKENLIKNLGLIIDNNIYLLNVVGLNYDYEINKNFEIIKI